MNEDDLKDVFSFGQFFGEKDPRSIRELKILIDKGLITVSRETLPSEPFFLINEAWFGGGEAHRQLCMLAATWLMDHWFWEPENGCEADYPGGRADVLSADEQIAVECGYTRASKIVDALRSYVSVLVVPYMNTKCGFLFRPVGDSSRIDETVQELRGSDNLSNYLKILK